MSEHFTPETCMKQLKEWGIAFDLHEHQAVFTVEEASALKIEIPGIHTRNLYLRTKKKKNYLITLRDETPVDLKLLSDQLDCGRFSFGSSDRLLQFLGVTPGSVTPFALMNDTDCAVQPVWDKSMFDHTLAGYHPLINTKTITVDPSSLHRLAEKTGHTPIIMDFTDHC